jgi:hypothetical protein
MLKALAVVAGIGVVLYGALLVAPFVAGYLYAGAMWPAFDYSCHEPEKADAYSRPDFHLYLLNRGCSLDAALPDVATDVQLPGGADRLKQFLKGDARPQGADETLEFDAAKQDLSRFRTPPSNKDCGRFGELCVSSYPADDFLSNTLGDLGKRYGAYLEPNFWSAVSDAAEALASFAAGGVAMRGILYVAYLVMVGVIASALWEAIKSAFAS